MPATGNVRWGETVGGYGKIGFEVTNVSATGTSETFTVNIWFWSKYTVDDSYSSLYYNNLSTTGSATYKDPLKQPGHIITTVASGSGWSESNQVKLASYTYTYTKGTSLQTRYLYAKLTDVDRVGGTMYANRTWPVQALDNYTVAYNANGGSGAPGSQTKWYGKTLTLSSTKPTRTGYTFKGWATSASATSATYQPGGSYTTEKSSGTGGGSLGVTVTLYAVWQANTYAVSYNANGGSGAPSSQTKTYGVTLTLSSTKPTRTNYTFVGWATTASATSATYQPGASYTANTAVTLYAVWSLSYIKPIIYNVKAERCDSAGTAKEGGKCGLITFDWETTNDVSEISIAWSATSAGAGSATVTASGKSGNISAIVGSDALTTEATYDITVTVKDSGGSSSAYVALPGALYPVDVLAGGKGVSFGKPAELGADESLGGNGVSDFAFDAKFNEPVYGKALGMDRLPSIPENSDLNNYTTTGCYAVYSNATAETISHIPVKRAGRLEVWSSTGEGVRLKQWSYLRQRYIPYNSGNAVWEREITRGEDNVWHIYQWWRSSLTPVAAEKVYSKAAVTLCRTENITLGTVNSYTKIPFTTIRAAINGRLNIDLNSEGIKIGANIDYVKVSGQVLVKCGSVTGNRHVRIQRNDGVTTSYWAWNCSYFTASQNGVLTLAPIVIPVSEGDILIMVFYTGDENDTIQSGSLANGAQTYFTAEEI